MSHQTTAKAIREYYGKHNIVSIGYCGAQNLLRFQSVDCYTCSVYGWDFDVYEVDGVAICTGYRNMPAGLHYSFERLSFLEKEAEKIACNLKLSYEEQKEAINELLKTFIDEVKQAN